MALTIHPAPDGRPAPFISACLMVKNEEEQLGRCLDSIVDFVDEIVIVDTGSTDATVDIAEKYTDRVFHSPWKNDFSFHRNESISHATGEWILYIDADERLKLHPMADMLSIRLWLDELSPDINALCLKVEDMRRDREGNSVKGAVWNSVRLFRKDRVRFENRVHNQPVFDGPAAFFHDANIRHYGYDLAPEKMVAKFKRTESLLLAQREEEPENRETAFYLCQLYGQNREDEKCLQWGERYLAFKNELGPAFNRTVYFTLISRYHAFGETEKAEALLKTAWAEDKKNPDVAAALADHGAMTGNLRLMTGGARAYIQNAAQIRARPIEMEGRFYFTLRDDVYTVNLYRLFMGLLFEASATWKSLALRLPLENLGIKSELFENLQKLGLEHAFSFERNELKPWLQPSMQPSAAPPPIRM